jgi:alpha-2-macroglobulin
MRKFKRQWANGAVCAGLLAVQVTSAAFDSAAPPAATELQVARVMPEGRKVPATDRQIVVTFDRPMNPLGSMLLNGAESPVSILPSVHCRWHWLDPRSLACELNETDALAPATQYSVAVKEGLHAEDGTQLKSAYRWTFATERPAVKEYSFRTWRSPGTPVVRLVFNQPVTQNSVQARIRFADQSVVATPDPYEPEVSAKRTDARRVWLVEPVKELSPDARVSLSVMPGLRSYAGPLLGTEHRTVVEFDTFPDFRFLGVRCFVGKDAVFLPVMAQGPPLAQGSQSARGSQPACNPFGTVSLAFSAPVIAPEIKAHLNITPDLAAGRTDYDPWANVYPASRLGTPHRRGTEYTVDFPEHLRAFQSYSIASLGAVRDEFGRRLRGTDAMNFRTDHRPPRLKVTHPVAVLEKEAPTRMSMYVTNLTDVDIHYRKLTTSGLAGGLTFNQPVDRAWDIAYAAPVKIRELLGGQSGVVSGSLYPHPTPPSADGTDYLDDSDDDDPGLRRGRKAQDFLVEVTPFQLHVKLGAYNTLVWVTSLAHGTPLAGARVRIYRDSYQGLTATPDVLGEGTTGRDGVAMLPGREVLEPPGATPARNPHDVLMVRVDANGDMGVLPLDGSFEVDTYRASRGKFWSGFVSDQNHIHAWGSTAQGVYKLGDTVQYKIYVRNQNNSTLEPAAQRDGYKLEIADPTGKTVKTEADVSLSEFGAYAGTFRVPATGAVGWYEFRLSGPASRAGSTPSGLWTPMRVLVADFTPAPFQVQVTLNGRSFEPEDNVEAATQASLHAGGPYASAASRITARLFPQAVEFDNPAVAGFEFASSEPEGQCTFRRAPDVLTVHQSDGSVDGKGELTTRFQLPDAQMVSARLEVESAIRDERGKYVANRVTAQYRGRDRLIGLRADRWTFEEGKPANIQYIVVDKNGRTVAGVPVSISAGVEVVSAARVKGAGDAYLTSYQPRWEPESSCSGASTNGPRTCTFTPSRPGLYSVVARIKDTHDRSHSTELCLWVTGKGGVLWQEPADMSLSLVPEKETYKVGERARYLIRNPFPGARALITIERFGVIKRWVQTLEGNTPVIDFKIEPDFMPGFYLSVVVTSPRVAAVPGTSPLDKDGVDLGRPTYRIGYVKVPVQDPYKMLDVRIESDRPSYKPRDTVKIELAAEPHNPGRQREPVEFAVAVLDEAVFDLIQDGRSYFDPYRGLYQFDNLDLVNYSLLSRLVGLQKFEKKGANSGGDGGAGFDMRNITQYVAYWNPSVIADARGHASFSFTLPDNLTGWRVFAIAVTPGDRVGLGDYKFKSSKLTELRPVLPNQLTAGDRFTAGFSVLNRSDKTRTLSVDIAARGPIENGNSKTHQIITLAPFKRETVWLPVTTTEDGTLEFTAAAADAADKDALRQSLAIHKRVSLDVAASYGTTESAAVDESLKFPAHMMPSVGELSVTLTPTVLGNVDGAFRYVKDYPYLCWEQRLTKALLAAGYVQLRGYLAPDLDWPEAQQLPQTMLDDAASFQAPNGGMDFWTPQDDRVSPYLSVATALAFNRLRAAGYRVPEDVQKNLDAYLDRLLREKSAPSFYSEGMVSSVRAVALQSLAERHLLKTADLQRYEPYASQMDLFGLAAFLDAAVKVKGAEVLAGSLARQILAHANQSAGQFQFSETWDDGYSQMLATPMRSECAILTAFLHYGETDGGAKLLGDVPFKLVRSITQSRGSRDHWENTQENLYCTSALAEYAAIYEKQTPALDVRASLDGTILGTAQFTALRDPPKVVRRANGKQDAGRAATLHIDRAGQGRLYYSTRLSYSPTDAAAKETNAGIEVHREYSVQRAGRWQLLTTPVAIKRGDLVRVDLYLSLSAARHFVVVDDPVPGGLEPVNRDLATASTVDGDESDFSPSGGSFWFKYSDWSEYGIALWSFYHRELKHDAARFYADYLPAGNYHLSYGAQAMAEGQFSAAPTKAEEMYDPDVYGKGMPAQFAVGRE